MSHDHPHPAGGGPTADVSVRVAWSDDAAAIASVQVRAWPALYADLVLRMVGAAGSPAAPSEPAESQT